MIAFSIYSALDELVVDKDCGLGMGNPMVFRFVDISIQKGNTKFQNEIILDDRWHPGKLYIQSKSLRVTMWSTYETVYGRSL